MADDAAPTEVKSVGPEATTTGTDWGDAPASEPVPANLNDGWGLPPSAGILSPTVGVGPPATPVSAEAPAFVPASQQPSSPEARGTRGGRRGRGERGAGRGGGRGGRGRSGAAASSAGAGAGAGGEATEGEAQEGDGEAVAATVEPPKRKEVYIRPAGPTREKMSPSDLEAKMEAMRLANAKLMERRAAADEDAAAYEAVERQAREKDEARRRHQAQIDEDRRLAAERKLGKLTGREWDREKKDADWDHSKPLSESMAAPEFYPPSFQRGGGRGRGRGFFAGERGDRGGRGRGGGRGGAGRGRGQGQGQGTAGNGQAQTVPESVTAAQDPTPAEAAARS